MNKSEKGWVKDRYTRLAQGLGLSVKEGRLRTGKFAKESRPPTWGIIVAFGMILETGETRQDFTRRHSQCRRSITVLGMMLLGA